MVQRNRLTDFTKEIIPGIIKFMGRLILFLVIVINPVLFTKLNNLILFPHLCYNFLNKQPALSYSKKFYLFAISIIFCIDCLKIMSL